MNIDRMGQALLTELGASAEEARSLAQGLDSDGDAALSREELLKGIAGAGKDPADPNSQILLRLADGLGRADGEVSQQEFGQLTGRLLSQGRA
jgi:Ca2+-binding EF-hand superfamily protein